MGAVKSCCDRPLDDKLLVTKMDLSHCGCVEVPHVVFNAERCIETLILASNQISSLPPQLFHCQEMKHLNLNDNCLSSIPPAIGTFLQLVSLKLDKNNLQELPEDLKMCKKLKRISLSNNPWKQVPNIVTQLINLEELYLNDCELSFLPASVGRLSKLKIIELRNNNLCNLPLSMSKLELLTRLDISDNDFNEFPTCIPKLKSLKELLLDNNDVEEIPDIKNLIHLEHFDASYNHIANVSETIGCCTELNMLNLSFNYIEQLPNSIGNVTYLQTLQLEMNELSEIPKSIGKLSHLEELNLCNNKLCTLPNTIGLLRKLRNLNISRNIIEELPPEIGSCSKLGIINAGYNRLRVLPPEIGYLNNLKVLDLVGNFLMYLPITIVNLRGVRAIWLSANQNVPLIPFMEDLNLASGERFLTNIALPQLGETPFQKLEMPNKKAGNNGKSSWSKKISFAEDEDLLPGKLHRTPTPFPKELRAPNRKLKQEEIKPNDNYVNITAGKMSEPEATFLQPVTVLKTDGGHVNVSEGCVTQIREANIRRNYKDMSLQNCTKTVITSESTTEDIVPIVDGENNILDRRRLETSSFHPKVNEDFNLNEEKCNNLSSLSFTHYTEADANGNPDHSEFYNSSVKQSNFTDFERISQDKSDKEPIIYSNVGCDARKTNVNEKGDGERMNEQEIQEIYRSDIMHGFKRCPGQKSPSGYFNGNAEDQPKHLYSNTAALKETFGCLALTAEERFRKNYSTPPPPPLPPPPPSHNIREMSPASSNEPEQPQSKEGYGYLTENTTNRKMAPPCYEIAKMYSTKAAFFENNRGDQLKSN